MMPFSLYKHKMGWKLSKLSDLKKILRRYMYTFIKHGKYNLHSHIIIIIYNINIQLYVYPQKCLSLSTCFFHQPTLFCYTQNLGSLTSYSFLIFPLSLCLFPATSQSLTLLKSISNFSHWKVNCQTKFNMECFVPRKLMPYFTRPPPPWMPKAS